MRYAEVTEVMGEKKPEFHVHIGTHVIGVSKTDFDARFHMHAINKALDEAYEAGQNSKLSDIAGVETIRVMSQEEVDELRKQWWTPGTK